MRIFHLAFRISSILLILLVVALQFFPFFIEFKLFLRVPSLVYIILICRTLNRYWNLRKLGHQKNSDVVLDEDLLENSETKIKLGYSEVLLSAFSFFLFLGLLLVFVTFLYGTNSSVLTSAISLGLVTGLVGIQAAFTLYSVIFPNHLAAYVLKNKK